MKAVNAATEPRREICYRDLPGISPSLRMLHEDYAAQLEELKRRRCGSVGATAKSDSPAA